MSRPDYWPIAEASVKVHEGLRLLPYRDTVGTLTIGYGRNLEDRGITAAEAEFLLTTDLVIAGAEAFGAWPWLRTQTAMRQAVIVEMTYNLGVPRLKGFARMLSALAMGRYHEAAQEMLDSTWRTQVGQRAVTLAERMRRG